MENKLIVKEEISSKAYAAKGWVPQPNYLQVLCRPGAGSNDCFWQRGGEFWKLNLGALEA